MIGPLRFEKGILVLKKMIKTFLWIFFVDSVYTHFYFSVYGEILLHIIFGMPRKNNERFHQIC